MRDCDFAGSWFPDNSSDCIRMLDSFRSEAESLNVMPLSYDTVPAEASAAVLPHAGWAFSGMTAWAALSQLGGKKVDLTVIFGGHLASSDRPTILDAEAWRTPVGTLEIDRTTSDKVASLGGFEIETERNYRRDNAVEILVPMVANLWPDSRIVVIGVPPTEKSLEFPGKIPSCIPPEMIARTFFIGSTDLTHYGPGYGFTPQGIGEGALDWVRNENDAKFLDAMNRLDPRECLMTALSNHNACCPAAAAAAISASRSTAAKIVDYRTSHFRTGGTPRDFVGYGAAVFWRTQTVNSV